MKLNKIYRSLKGFTLVEMAIVLTIVGLLMAAFLTPLDAQMQQNRINEARNDLAEIKQALLGFASVNLSLPCPDTTGDGVADPCVGLINNTTSTGGNVPWVTLGIKPTDPWDRRYQYRVNNAFTLAPLTLAIAATPGQLRVCTDNTCVASEANSVPAVIYSSGANGGVQPPLGADELENTRVAGATFNGIFVNHEFAAPAAPNGAFDDVMDWISTNVLLGQLVAAGQIP
jgi:prepilin-type N-terminal cleavage/methylation domain-containing protein